MYGLTEGAAALAAGAVPVLVEGPIDAIAVTLAGGGDYVGVAPLGTALTDTQVDKLAPHLGAGRARRHRGHRRRPRRTTGRSPRVLATRCSR